jgi:hypothetical protein
MHIVTNTAAVWCWLFLFVFPAAGQEMSIDSIDLLESLHLHNTSHQGVTETPGPQRLKPAYSLQGEYVPSEQCRTANFTYIYS